MIDLDPSEATARAVAAGVELTEEPAQRVGAVKAHFISQLDETTLSLEELEQLFLAHPEWREA